MAEVLSLFGLCYHGLRRSVGQLSKPVKWPTSRPMLCALCTIFLLLLCLGLDDLTPAGAPPNNTMVLIPGGGIAGIIAARTPHEQGINDFAIVEAKSIFSGRMTK
ncbi:hypothetical protein EDC04DRAFT_1843005 [Pisolithus marmoratus]|nr:hypothetical protein EDC04DRAFT_1843005 [Pisolithus marmoratus]